MTSVQHTTSGVAASPKPRATTTLSLVGKAPQQAIRTPTFRADSRASIRTKMPIFEALPDDNKISDNKIRKHFSKFLLSWNFPGKKKKAFLDNFP